MADQFYVYELVDPLTEEVFYVGKGCRDRFRQHAREVRSGRSAPGAKAERIAAIHAEGLDVRHRIVARYCDEMDAIRHEEALIAQYGIDNLTNILRRGAPSAGETAEAMARRVIRNAKADMRNCPGTLIAKEAVRFALAGHAILRKIRSMEKKTCRA